MKKTAGTSKEKQNKHDKKKAQIKVDLNTLHTKPLPY